MSAAVRESVERAVAGRLVAGMCLHQARAMAGIVDRVMLQPAQGGCGPQSVAMGSLGDFCVNISDSPDLLQ